MAIGTQCLEPEDFEAELISMAPDELQADIQRLADKARKKQE